MVQHKTLSRLAVVIQAVAEGEQRTEVIRQVLAEQRHFEPLSAFRRLDKTKQGELSATDLIDFLGFNKIVINMKEAKQLQRSLDLNGDGRVTYTDFAESILPLEDARLKQIANMREGYCRESGEPLPYEVEWSLARVLEQEIKNFRNYETHKDSLSSAQDYNKLDIFNALDEAKQGALSIAVQLDLLHHKLHHQIAKYSIDQFMRVHGKELTHDQLAAVFRRFGAVDAITFPQLSELITPVNPSAATLNASQQLRSTSPLGQALKGSLRSSGKGPSSSTRLNNSKLLEGAAKDNEYQEYLARSQNFERMRNSGSLVSNMNGTAGGGGGGSTMASPNRRSNNFGSTVKYAEQQRSPYHSFNNKSNLLTHSVFASKFGSISSGVNVKGQPQQRKQVMKGNEEEHLVRALKEQMVLDKDVEELKNQLALRQDFNAEDGFRVFDRKARGHVSQFEFELALNDINIYPTKDELHLFYRRYDRDNDGLLKFSDFNDVILPMNPELSALSKSRMPNYMNPDDGIANLSRETRQVFKKLLTKMFETEVELEYIRQKLAKRPAFSLYDAFMAIDNQDQGFITMDSFKQILLDYGIKVTASDICQLIQRYDRNFDNKISFPEFMNELTPKSSEDHFVS